MNLSDWSRLLAFAHPAWMLAGLTMAIATARLGVEIRRRRLRGEPPGRRLRDRHLRFGRIAIVMVAVGFLSGPPSMFFIREREFFDSFHGVLGIIVLGLYLWTGVSGRALARGNGEARDIHRVAAAAAIGASMLSAIAGFTLLP